MTAIINCTLIMRDHFIPDAIIITDGEFNILKTIIGGEIRYEA